MLTPADKAGGSVWLGQDSEKPCRTGRARVALDRSVVSFHDAADRDAICQHVVIVMIPFAGWAGCHRAFESAAHSSPIRCTGVAAGGNAVPSGTRFTMIVTTPSAACICCGWPSPKSGGKKA